MITLEKPVIPFEKADRYSGEIGQNILQKKILEGDRQISKAQKEVDKRQIDSQPHAAEFVCRPNYGVKKVKMKKR